MVTTEHQAKWLEAIRQIQNEMSIVGKDMLDDTGSDLDMAYDSLNQAIESIRNVDVTHGNFPVIVVTWHGKGTYVGVRPADTAESFINRLKSCMNDHSTNNKLITAVRNYGLDAVICTIAAEFNTESEALQYANSLIDGLVEEMQLNHRHLSSSAKRRQQG
jgi:hypothetical protein